MHHLRQLYAIMDKSQLFTDLLDNQTQPMFIDQSLLLANSVSHFPHPFPTLTCTYVHVHTIHMYTLKIFLNLILLDTVSDVFIVYDCVINLN